MRLTRQRPLEDTQEYSDAMLAAWRLDQAGELEDRKYAFRKVYFDTIDIVRTRSRRKLQIDQFEELPEEIGSESLECDDVLDLREAIGKLDDLHRRVVEMRLEGMEHRDIAKALGRSESWSCATFKTACVLLRSLLEE
jgi:DNA-directed RNA polymerase specialized sigma24 family protein